MRMGNTYITMIISTKMRGKKIIIQTQLLYDIQEASSKRERVYDISQVIRNHRVGLKFISENARMVRRNG
mgnify:CR=1 FL=1